VKETHGGRGKQADPGMADNLHFFRELGFRSREALERGDLHGFAELMNVHWEHKKKRSRGGATAPSTAGRPWPATKARWAGRARFLPCR
jgi:galactokinase/mevalonate kinase-like predicted kinase